MVRKATEIILALEKEIAVELDEWSAASTKNARLRKVATAICAAKWGSENTERATMGFSGGNIDTLSRLGNGTVAIQYPMQPAWATYLREAQAAIDAVDANLEKV